MGGGYLGDCGGGGRLFDRTGPDMDVSGPGGGTKMRANVFGSGYWVWYVQARPLNVFRWEGGYGVEAARSDLEKTVDI